jgi:hypothetical protein
MGVEEAGALLESHVWERSRTPCKRWQLDSHVVFVRLLGMAWLALLVGYGGGVASLGLYQNMFPTLRSSWVR